MCPKSIHTLIWSTKPIWKIKEPQELHILSKVLFSSATPFKSYHLTFYTRQKSLGPWHCLFLALQHSSTFSVLDTKQGWMTPLGCRPCFTHLLLPRSLLLSWKTYPELGTDSRSAPLGAHLQCLFTATTTDSFKKVIDEVQPEGEEKN